jgi:hypothetical protein
MSEYIFTITENRASGTATLASGPGVIGVIAETIDFCGLPYLERLRREASRLSK